jgi:Zn-finger nucleic acid-binding protein
MKCPADGEMLVMTERSGVEIDHCPKCRGVWLDRGELDKIIERGAASAPPPQSTQQERPQPQDEPRRGGFFRDDDDDHYERGGKRRRREGFLSDIFDF